MTDQNEAAALDADAFAVAYDAARDKAEELRDVMPMTDTLRAFLTAYKQALPAAPLASTVAAPGVGEIEALRKALEPFAKIARHMDEKHADAWTEVSREFSYEEDREAMTALGLDPTQSPNKRMTQVYSLDGLTVRDWLNAEEALAAPTPVAASGPTLGGEALRKALEDRVILYSTQPGRTGDAVIAVSCDICKAEVAGDDPKWIKHAADCPLAAPTSAGPSLVAADVDWFVVKEAVGDALSDGEGVLYESQLKDHFAKQKLGIVHLDDIPSNALAIMDAERPSDELLIKAALYDFLREQHGYSYGHDFGSMPSPVEHGISWEWRQSTPEIPSLEDQLQAEAFAYYDNFINERDPDEKPTDWEMQVVKYRDALRPLTPQGEAQEKK